ncbi:MAG: damage-inducible protein [Pseudonocardiales bacterium]|nr:MAG: damage-inducible protein [Pseudonocardiales bacterium]
MTNPGGTASTAPETSSGIAARVHARLSELGATVAVAESLTGGLLCAALTDPPGASTTVRGGLVVYASELKSALAGVSEALLDERGAVDPEVALALARGARTRLGATYGVGVTGVAGPDPQDGKPVGTLFAAVAGPRGEVVREDRLAGSRAEIRAAAVRVCLELLSAEYDRPG